MPLNFSGVLLLARVGGPFSRWITPRPVCTPFLCLPWGDLRGRPVPPATEGIRGALRWTIPPQDGNRRAVTPAWPRGLPADEADRPEAGEGSAGLPLGEAAYLRKLADREVERRSLGSLLC